MWGGMCGRQGACMVGNMHGRGHAWGAGMVVGVHGGMYAGETATEADGCEKVNSSDI